MTDRNLRTPAVRHALLLLVACAVLALPGQATAQQTAPQEPDDRATRDGAAAQSTTQPTGEAQGPRLVGIPKIDYTGLEPAVARQLEQVDAALQSLLARASGQGGSQPSAAEVAAGFGDLGRHYQAYGLDDAAAACYHNASELSPRDARWPHLLGRALQQAGRLPQAVEAYRRALELAPSDLPALVYLAEVRTHQGRPEEAVEHYRAAVALEPDSPAALAGLGQAALDAGDAEEAVARLEAALAAQPAANRLHYPLGLAYRALGNEEKARENLLAAGNVGVRPVDPLVDDLENLKSGERVHLLRGHMAFRAGDYGSAADAYHRALQQAPESVVAHVDLATALSRLGYLEGAEEQLREALSLAPDNANTHYNLGALLAGKGNAPGAGVHLRRAISLDPEDGAAHLALAETLAAGPPEDA
ncbi:MAG TPA: tetratricopeptide repeat protein, partial [Thermoanaerobaculia bacterium]|nr:tetratricopeptide repeat protein [Thermoanaerobaculia bacterium]